MARDLATLFGVSEQAVGLWVSREGCPRRADKRFDLIEVVKWVRERDQKPRSASDPEAKYTKAELRRQEADARMAERKDAKEAGELLEKKEVEREQRMLARAFKRSIERMPTELAAVLAGREAGEVERVLKGKVERVLRELSS